MRAACAIALLLALGLAGPAEADLDRSFANGRGWKTIDVGSSDSGADEVLRTRAGKIVLAGFGRTSGSYLPALAVTRLHPSGRTDSRFGRRGEVIVRAGDNPSLVAMRESRGGKLLLAFTSFTQRGSAGVVRLHRSGRLDRSYGERGIARITLPGTDGLVADMALLPGGKAVLAATATMAPGDPRVVLVRLSGNGRSATTSQPPLGAAEAVGLVRTRLGHLMLAAQRPKTADVPAAAILTGLGAAPPSRVLEGMDVVDVDADRRSGVAVLLKAGNRWGVRRYAERLAPRRAPGKLPSAGSPFALDVARGSASWVGLDNGVIGRVRPDGRPDTRFAPRGRTTYISTPWTLSTSAVAAVPGGRAVLAGRGLPRYYGDIREDYGVQEMWIARFRR